MQVENDILIPELARLLTEEKEVRFTPSGVSMRPFIEGDRDSVILAPLTTEPKRGDILLAYATTADGRQTYVLHRLIRIEHSSTSPSSSNLLYILQGDGNLSCEESCLRSDILGRVTAIETPSGRKKCLTRGRIWFLLKPVRKYLLKLYRKCAL